MAYRVGDLFTFYDITAITRNENGTIVGQIGNAINEDVLGAEIELWGIPGLASLPAPPQQNADDCAQCIAIDTGGDMHAIAYRDTRYQAVVGNLQPGDTVLYSNGATGEGQARVFLKGNGNTITLYTAKDGSSKAMGLIMDPVSDSISCFNSLGVGWTIDKDGFHAFGADGASGIHSLSNGKTQIIATDTAQMDGTSIILGSNPLPVVSSVLRGISGFAATPSTKVFTD